ncbi:MAG: NAD(P)(+) transhydrogenase (Re/Si-specific) subunit beta [Gemmatimonadetes bacterium]|nr:NAD(P)(+) transhydrogenase (Re/Si-specific) subunit beta [Gemmatimonadota bacterium]
MTSSLLGTAYLGAGVLFIMSLKGLSHPESARRGNLFGALGMIIAVLAVAVQVGLASAPAILGTVLVAGIIGAVLAARVSMTSMPQLVAILHSFVGAAAVLVGISNHLHSGVALVGAELTIHEIETFVGVFIGALTFTGSIIAWGKLQGVIHSKPLLLPGRHLINLALVLVSVWLGVVFVGGGEQALTALLAVTAIAGVIGILLVMAIGGADMPVVVSMLNSYSGWAASAAGFMLSNDLLIITGALVGSSGAILSYIMCKAMNRSFISVILGGFGAEEGAAPAGGAAIVGEMVATTAEDVVESLREASSVIIVPGYGMAVAQAQHPVKEIVEILRKRKVQVRFAIHPVAGRLPGHMNVLLAEANLPYDIVLEMDEISDDFAGTDVVLVIGANDIVNPSALDDPTSPIAGMPVLPAWEAESCIVFKRGRGAGYAGVENPLFFKPKTRMLYGDAKASVDAILRLLQQA